jgi:hypothetical protein
LNPLDDIATARDTVDAQTSEPGVLVSRPGDYAEDMGSHVAIRREDGTLLLSLSHAEYEDFHARALRRAGLIVAAQRGPGNRKQRRAAAKNARRR